MRDYEVSSNRTMRLVTLLLLGGWASLTALIGLLDVANGVRNWQVFHDPDSGGHHLPFFFDAGFFILWILSCNLLIPALVLGVIQTARVHRQAWTPLAFAAVVITGPIAAFAFNELRNGGDDPGLEDHLFSWVTLGGFGFCVIAAATMAAAWVLLRNVGTVDVADAPPTSPAFAGATD